MAFSICFILSILIIHRSSEKHLLCVYMENNRSRFPIAELVLRGKPNRENMLNQSTVLDRSLYELSISLIFLCSFTAHLYQSTSYLNRKIRRKTISRIRTEKNTSLCEVWRLRSIKRLCGKWWWVTMIETNSSHTAMVWTEYFLRLDHMRHTYTHSMVSTQLTTSHKDRLFVFFFIFSLERCLDKE